MRCSNVLFRRAPSNAENASRRTSAASDAGTNHSAPRTSTSRTVKIVSPDFIACTRSAAALTPGFFAASSGTVRPAEAVTPSQSV